MQIPSVAPSALFYEACETLEKSVDFSARQTTFQVFRAKRWRKTRLNKLEPMYDVIIMAQKEDKKIPIKDVQTIAKPEDIHQKMSLGWIKVNSVIEALAADKNIVERSLKEHVSRIERENGNVVIGSS